MMKKLFTSLLLAYGVSAGAASNTTLSGLNPQDFVAQVDGGSTALYVLRNKAGAEACFTNWGGRWVSMMVPDRNGKMTDVVLGYDNIRQYLDNPTRNYGGLIGRYTNRIANAQFSLDGNTYHLEKNNQGKHSLHGGSRGFHTRLWKANQPDAQTLELTYLSADGEEGFPGNLTVHVTYRLSDDNALSVRYEAQTDRATVVSLTNHTYFNLSGKLDTQITDHTLQINADRYLPTDAELIPTGAVESVTDTPLDLRRATVIGSRIDSDFEQMVFGGRGFNHHWILNSAGDIAKRAVRLTSPTTGIALDMYTTEPGTLVYTGNMMPMEGDMGKHGIVYPHRGAVSLEPEHNPDSPNHPEFPTTVLRPGQKYVSQTVFRFLRR